MATAHLLLLLLRLETLLIADELLFHEEEVLDALQFEQLQPAACVRRH